MELQLYSIFDKKTRIFHPPTFAHNAGHCMRILTDVFSRENSVYINYPEDFEVYEVGSFNDKDAKIKTINPARLLCTARDLISKQKIAANKIALFKDPREGKKDAK